MTNEDQVNPIVKTRLMQLRLEHVMGWSLQRGSHTENGDGNACVMELC